MLWSNLIQSRPYVGSAPCKCLPVFSRSVSITYLITLTLENEIIVFWKKFRIKSEIFYPNICANPDYENSTKGTNNYPLTADHYYGKVLDALRPAKSGFHISLIG